MRLRVVILSVLILSGLCFYTNSYAKMNDYVFPYDISEAEWQLLNWTSAWKNTNLLADPFLLERIEFQRKTRVIHVYLYGTAEQAANDVLQKSVDKVNGIFSQRFPKFDIKTDMVIHFLIKPDSGQPYTIEYAGGAFGQPGEELAPLKSSMSSSY